MKTRNLFPKGLDRNDTHSTCIRMICSADEAGSAFIMSVMFLAVLMLLVGATIISVTSRAPLPNQGAAWDQARLGAEAGIDLAISQLDAALSGSSWNNWVQSDGVTAVSGTTLAVSGSQNATTGISGSSGVVYTSTNIVSTTGTNAFVNVNLRAIGAGGTGTQNTWYIIRSMGTASISGPARSLMEGWDSNLRRASLRQVRNSLANEMNYVSSLYPAWWNQTPVPPTVSRVVQVLAKPYYFNPFTFAIYTDQTMSLGNSSNYFVDSYSSTTSTNGQYPGGTIVTNTSAANYGNSAHALGDIGTNDTATGAIATNGSTVYGTGQTPIGTTGVDVPSNVTGGVSPVPAIPLPIPVPPATTGWSPVVATTPATIPVAGTAANPTQLHYTNGGSFTFSGTGYVTLVIDSDWSASSVVVPASVHATIYVGGNIDFGNGSVNTGSGSSGIPGNLIIYGTAPASSNPTGLSAHGNPTIAAAFYGPSYAVTLKGGGNGAFYGSIIAKSFNVSGGGNSSIHYDEALGNLKIFPVTKYQISSYIEDTRL